MINSKKAVMIGCGFVGSASVFALMKYVCDVCGWEYDEDQFSEA